MLSDKRKEIEVLWLHSKYGNFTKDKTYHANARYSDIKGDMFTGFVITDEDGDLYTLNEKQIGKDFIVL